jgi:hypothetical protein
MCGYANFRCADGGFEDLEIWERGVDLCAMMDLKIWKGRWILGVDYTFPLRQAGDC